MSNSIINSSRTELCWVEQTCKTFTQESIIDIDEIDSPPCVFRVPKNLKDTKPEAYAPQQIGLGPYHHFRPEFYVFQRKKIAAINRFFKGANIKMDSKDFQDHVPKELRKIEPTIRACYDEFIDISGVTLALMLAIDGLYLLQILAARAHEKGESFATNYHGKAESSVAPEKTTALPVSGRDLFMLENQIPRHVLNEIILALKFTDKKDNQALSLMYLRLIEERSPLILSGDEGFRSDSKSPHLLAHMYHLIVNNGCESAEVKRSKRLRRLDYFESRMERALELAAKLHVPGAETLLTVSQNIKEIAGLITETEQSEEKKPAVVEIDIPSASQLHGIAKVQFKKLTTGGIRHVEFKREENALYLPEITLREESEVILRNLLAYEAAAAAAGTKLESDGLELAEYVDLMCGIIDTDEDVTLLRHRDVGIIKAEDNISDEQIAGIFNGISKSTRKEDKHNKSTGKEDKHKSKIEEAIVAMNELYDNTFRGKVSNLLKKTIGNSWKFLVPVATLLVVMLLALESICLIFDCSKAFGLSAYLTNSLF